MDDEERMRIKAAARYMETAEMPALELLFGWQFESVWDEPKLKVRRRRPSSWQLCVLQTFCQLAETAVWAWCVGMSLQGTLELTRKRPL